MCDINYFLENNCGLKKETNIIEKELQKTDIEIKKKDWENYDINKYDLEKENNFTNNDKRYIEWFENNFNNIQIIMDELHFKNELYSYLENKELHCDETDLLYQKENIENFVCIKKKKYVNEIQSLKKSYTELKQTQIDEKQIKDKYKVLQETKIEKNKNIENLPPFEVISLQDELDKIDRDIKKCQETLENIPKERENIKNNLKEMDEKIIKYEKFLEIINNFQINLYIDYLETKINKIKNEKENGNLLKNIQKKNNLLNMILFGILFFSIINNYHYNLYVYLFYPLIFFIYLH
tara:strand:+ start:862 stop:1746 length:885 start_codon:yes stop_codon:yes gene_type:complete